MIRYPTTVDGLGLTELIDQESSNWRAKAAETTAAIQANGKYDKDKHGEGWGDIKGAFMRLQHNKCAYCERKLGGGKYTKREHDVEHFRPKGRLQAWPNKSAHTHLLDDSGKLKTYAHPLGSAEPQGYHLLAFEPLNYCTACARCNQSLKADYFPVRGTRKLNGTLPASMKSEKPFLIFPLGDWDDDPESLVGFDGPLAIALAKSGFKRERAEVTIDFFALNGEELTQMRSFAILAAHSPFARVTRNDPTDPELADAQRVASALTAPFAPHASCMRSYLKLCKTKPQRAKAFFDLAVEVFK